MRRAVLSLTFIAAACTAASAQIDTRRIEAIEEQALLREGRAFAVGVRARLPVTIVGIQEMRQPDGRARFAVMVKNLASDAVPAYSVSAAVVSNDGRVKAWQPLDPVKQLKPGQSRRQEITVRVAVPALTDVVAFAITEVASASGQTWKAPQAELEDAIRSATGRLPR